MKTMKTYKQITTLWRTLCAVAVIAGLTACEADTVERQGGKLPDEEPLKNTYGMLRSGNSAENSVDILLTEGGGFVTDNFYYQSTQPAADNLSVEAWINGSLLDGYNGTQEIERTLLPEANYDFPDGKKIDLSKEDQRSALKRIRFLAEGLEPGEYMLPLTVASEDAQDEANKTLYYNVSVREFFKGAYPLDRYTDEMYPEADVEEPLFIVFYINTKDYQPLLVTDFYMQKKKRKPAEEIWMRTIGNIINLRTVVLDYDPTSGRALLNLGSDMTYVLSHAAKYIWPLQEENRKVCISIEGGGTGLGFCNLSDAQIADFVGQVKTVIEEYKLDGVNLWDRSSSYGKEGMPAMNTTSYPKLIKAMREALGTEKLLTVTDHMEPTEYFWDTEATGGIAVGDYIDYAWSGYCNEEEIMQILDPWHPDDVEVSQYTHKPFAGLDKSKYGCINAPWYNQSSRLTDVKHVIRWRLAGNKPSNILVFKDLMTVLQDAYEGSWQSSFGVCAAYANDGKTGTGILNTLNNYNISINNLSQLPDGNIGYGKWKKDWK